MNFFASFLAAPGLVRLGWVLIHFLWEGLAVALMLAVALRVTARVSASVRYGLAALALALCAAAPVATWLVLPSAASAPIPLTASMPAAVAMPDPVRPPEISRAEFSAAAPPAAERPWFTRLAAGAEDDLPWVVGLWLLGVAILSSRLALGWMWMRRLVRSGMAVREGGAPASLARLLARMRIGRPVRLVESALVEVPMLIGWLRPAIVVPVSLLAGLTPPQLEAILAHELAHVRRHDYLANMLQTVVETVLFYHPAVWWIGRRLREERENCCDDLALAVMQDRLLYVTALARLEEGRASALALTATGGSLLARIRRIAGVGERKGSVWPLWGVVAVLLAAACVAKTKADPPKSTPAASPSAQAAGDARFDFLHNQLRLENVKATNMPLDQFVGMLSKEFKAKDPLKEGLLIVLQVPPGEEPLPVTIDFSTMPGYRANESMIFGYLKARYPIRYREDHGVIYLMQMSRAEVAFRKKAEATRIDLDFHQADPVEALTQVQAASAGKGFKVDLDVKTIRALDALRPLPKIDLVAREVSVEQALRSICYLADLHAQPLEHFTGYLFQPQAPEATKALTYLQVGTEIPSFAPGTEEEKQTWDSLQKVGRWTGPATEGPAFPSSGMSSVEWKLPDGSRKVLGFQTTIVDKARLQLELTLELKDQAGKSLGKVKGSGEVASGARVILAAAGKAALVKPAYGSTPAQGFVGLIQVTLMNRDGEPLLPAPSPGVQEIEAVTVAPVAAPSPSSQADVPAAPVTGQKLVLAQALAMAAAKGDLAETGRLLGQGADPNVNVDPDGRDALFAAVVADQAGTLKLLLQHGADPNHKNEAGKEPIDQALDQGRVDLAALLRDAGAKVSPEAWAGATGDLPALQALAQAGVIRAGHTGAAMKYAVSAGHLEAVKYLEGIDGKPVAGKFLAQAAKSGNVAMMQYILDRGANMKTDGGDAMDTAVLMYDQVPAVKFLLAHGADPNRFTRWNEDILSGAKSAAMVKILLEAGANPNALGDRDCPLTHAPDAESVRLLVQHGANLKPRLKDGLTLIQSAISPALPDRPEVIDALIKAGAEFDPQGNGVDALIAAAQFNHVGAMAVLLDHGVSPNAYSNAPFVQSSALGSAAWEPSFEAVQLLLKRGANPEGDPREAQTPLSDSIIFGQNDSAKLLRQAGAHDVGELSNAAALGDVARMNELLRNGANVNETNRAGDTPLFFAVRRAQVEAARLLLAHGANVSHFDAQGLTPQNEFELETSSLNPQQFEMDWGVSEDEGKRRAAALKELLAQNPGDPNYRDARGRTVLHQMALAGNTMVDFELSDKTRRADPNAKDNEGNTPLLLAALSSHATETVTRISDLDPADPAGKKMKDWNSQAYIARQLIQAGARLDLPMAGGKSTVGAVAVNAAVAAKNEQLVEVLAVAEKKEVQNSPQKNPVPGATSPATTVAAQGSTGAELAAKNWPGFIRFQVRIMQVDDSEYLAHRAEIDAAVKRGDSAPLARLKSFDLLSEPTALVKSGESATLEAIRVLPVPVKFTRDTGGTYPTDFERRNLGVTIPFSVEKVGDKIDVSGKLSVSTFEGWTESGSKTFSPSINTVDAYFFDELTSGQTVGLEAAGGQGHAEADLTKVGYRPMPPKLTRLFFFLTAEMSKG